MVMGWLLGGAKIGRVNVTPAQLDNEHLALVLRKHGERAPGAILDLLASGESVAVGHVCCSVLLPSIYRTLRYAQAKNATFAK